MKLKYMIYALQGELKARGLEDVSDVLDLNNPNITIIFDPVPERRCVLFDYTAGGQKPHRFRKLIEEILTDICEKETHAVIRLPKKKPR